MKRVKFLLSSLALLFALMTTSCAVHEWPNDVPFDVNLTINLDYKTEMPLYDIIEQTSRLDALNKDYDIRYTLEYYLVDENGKYSEDDPVIRETFIKEKFETSDDFKHTVQMSVPARNYIIYVWTDIVEHDKAPANLFYDHADFDRVYLMMSKYVGNTDLRDAFTGHASADLSGYLQSGMSATVDIVSERPMAKIQFITTDVEEFILKYMAMKEKEVGHKMSTDDYTRLLDLQQFTVRITYSYNMPSAFSLHENRPKDSVDRPSFEAKILPLGDNEASMGFDYVFVRAEGAEQQLDIALYDVDGRLLSQVLYIPIPIKRSQLTIVRSKFLTTDIQGGAVINPDFAPDDDNFIYWIE